MSHTHHNGYPRVISIRLTPQIDKVYVVSQNVHTRCLQVLGLLRVLSYGGDRPATTARINTWFLNNVFENHVSLKSFSKGDAHDVRECNINVVAWYS